MKKIFISYSHENKSYRKRLGTHLGNLMCESALGSEDALDVWSDEKMLGGDEVHVKHMVVVIPKPISSCISCSRVRCMVDS